MNTVDISYCANHQPDPSTPARPAKVPQPTQEVKDWKIAAPAPEAGRKPITAERTARLLFPNEGLRWPGAVLILEAYAESRLSTVVEVLRPKLDEIEREFCRCGAELDRNKPKTWEWCSIHDKCDAIHQQFPPEPKP